MSDRRLSVHAPLDGVGPFAAGLNSELDASGGGFAATPRKPASAASLPLAAILCDEVVPRLIERVVGDAGGGHAARRPKAETFLNTLLGDDGEARAAHRLARAGLDPQQAVADLLGPAARLVGDRWCEDECDFVTVTLVMARIQRLFWNLVAGSPPTAVGRAGGGRAAADRANRSILLGPVPGDQHGFGLSVVEDAFRRTGWHVDCCSFDDGPRMLDLAAGRHYAVIGLSIGGEAFAPALAGTIAALRRRSRNRAVRILAGGAACLPHPGLALAAGADHVARDPSSALDLAERVAKDDAESHIVAAAD